MIVNGTSLSSDTNNVIARFPDCVLAFEMPAGATLADLAERLAGFEERMHATPISVAVRPAP